MSSSNQRGISHAPGVLCYISIPGELSDVGLSLQGKFVTLVKLESSGFYKCINCNKLGFRLQELAPWWLVQSQYKDLKSCVGLETLSDKSSVPQRFLIPIGNQDLRKSISAEDLMEKLRAEAIERIKKINPDFIPSEQ